ncbi:GGDEF domain-containing protein [Treponema sp.]|uniref:GGDEF domain-containing protein n=1 Tax=Treponema sp. TaxID=166 RepID=UPI0025E20C44|nr:GGDEF domain-containing protein [Treponema sp.]MBR4321372.1 GGDEF domain-containing protein [Treponema sp.]
MDNYYIDDSDRSGSKKSKSLNLLSSFLIVLTAVVFVFIILISYAVNKNFGRLKKSLNRYIVSSQSFEMIKSSSNELTELVRLFVINHDERFALSYVDIIENNRSQKSALESLRSVYPENDTAFDRLELAISQADNLIELELYDMRLCYEAIGKSENEIPELIRNIRLSDEDKKLSKEKMQELAVKKIFGNGYLIYKLRVDESCFVTVKIISDEIKNELDFNSESLARNLDRLRILILLLLVINALSMIGLREFKTISSSYRKIYELDRRRAHILLKNAEYDALTGILNRRAYEEICQSSREQRMSIALLLIDMDNFKKINDTYGHAGGDAALKALAEILKDTFRNGDYVARIGGDEFAAVLTDFKPEGFRIVTEKISFINEQLSRIENIRDVSVSVGIAFAAEGYNEELYKQADKALYAVKSSGKKSCRIYDSSLA